eukprot:10731648-Alexandrium_andersonii.AAC.1
MSQGRGCAAPCSLEARRQPSRKFVVPRTSEVLGSSLCLAHCLKRRSRKDTSVVGGGGSLSNGKSAQIPALSSIPTK